MITAQYKRDLNHNYLILPLKEGAAASYQMQMITKNKIEGLLTCQKKMAEDGAACYYEISSRQSLRHIFMTSEMDYRELKNLLTCIYMILQRMENYLLDSKCLVLEPEYVYMDAEQGKVWLTYLPGYEDSAFIGMKHLAEFILSKVNHKDEQAAELAYYLYQCTKEENFSFCHVAEYIEKQKSPLEAGLQSGVATAGLADGRQTDAAMEAVEYNMLYADKSGNEMKEAPVSWKVMRNRLLFLCMGGTILIIAVCVYVFMNYYLSPQVKAVGAGAIAALYAAFVILYVHLYRNYKIVDEVCEASYSSDMPYTAPYTSESDAEEEENEEYGNTVFFGSGSDADKGEHYLEGECRGSKIHYVIDKKQITIGKMKGKVDIALNDTSVSRIHAGICKSEHKVFLTDLNSTNGTYKNGVMLQPGEAAELEAGDELRFGKICLAYH